MARFGALHAGMVLVALLLAPVLMPILPPATLIKTYGESTLATANGSGGSGETGPLPQNLGDRLGWDAMVSTVAQVYDRVPANERSQVCILASNYGEASAMNFLGRGLGLPETISGHNSYFIWGPGSCTGQVLITIGISASAAKQEYANVTQMATISCQYCMDLENNVPVLLCTGPQFSSITAVWPQVRQYD
jgi:hypothetical protein